MEFHIALILVVTANAAPLVARYFLPFHGWDYPVDGNKHLWDERPVFGRSKTYRGLVVSLVTTSFVSWLLGLSILAGMIISLLAMMGDLLSSFIKRRIGYPSGKMVLGLDQLAESFLPFYFLHVKYNIDLFQVSAGIILFVIIDLVFTRLVNILQKPVKNP